MGNAGKLEPQVAQRQSYEDGYRRFRVKGALGAARNDDFAAMREVVGRRYRRLRDEGQALPDVVLIDGGLGQLHAAQAALAEEQVQLPMECFGFWDQYQKFTCRPNWPPETE